MSKPKRKSNSRRKAVRAARALVAKFIPSPDIIHRSVTVEEAVAAVEKKTAICGKVG